MNDEQAISPPALVSACLIGLPTRYDGKVLGSVSLPEQFKGRILIPVCPEQLGGLPTPRPKQEFRDGSGFDVLAGKARVINEDGIDVTENFLRGARIACRIAELVGAKEAFLKDGSPSCGVTRVTVDGSEVTGLGVAAAALKQLGIALYPCD
jgi:uncharacterized protein YbbK (DUF523 family)